MLVRALKMASPGVITVERTLICKLELILPVQGQKVKGIGPGTFEVLIGSREQEPARTTIATRLRRNLDTSLQELQSMLVISLTRG